MHTEEWGGGGKGRTVSRMDELHPEGPGQRPGPDGEGNSHLIHQDGA